ncbi:ligand-binding sensor domain-containing protein [Reichenbachiella sp.]|uniref:ligand-binding sensor domain-containing protein n=1 Tax=Reichenbachiella sp. TaxID=2184521 RepID=UPI003B5A82DD
MVYNAVSAQTYHSARINKYTQNEGLSSDDITKIIKDQYGFIWLGTQEGLNVFDGNSFEVFSNQSTPKRNLNGSYILDLIEDKKRSQIWVLTSLAPISCIDLKSRTIINFLQQDSENQSYTKVWARSISLKDDLLWIGGLNTLSVFDIIRNQYINIPSVKERLREMGEYNISKIKHDSFGNVWLLMDGQGIVILDEDHEVLKIFHPEELNYKKNTDNLFFWDVTNNKDQMVIGTGWGLLQLKTGSSADQILLNKNSNIHFKNEPIYSLNVISDSLILFASNSNFYIKNTISNNFQILQDHKKETISNIYKIYYDTDSRNIWIGSRSGLMSFSLAQKPFDAVINSSNNELSLDHINSLLATDERSIYAVGPNGFFALIRSQKTLNYLTQQFIAGWFFRDQKIMSMFQAKIK